jgi:hypothetical protein
MNWQKIGKYAKYGLYALPFYGIIVEYAKPKEERSKPRINISKAITTGFVVKLGIMAVYTITKGVTTGDWDPIHFGSKDKKTNSSEINPEIDKTNNLEKTVHYEELLK